MSDEPDSIQPERFPREDSPTPTGDGLRVPAPGSFTPRVRPASISADAAPAGASYAPPTPAPLPDRGATIFLFINLVAAVTAVTFTVLLASKL